MEQGEKPLSELIGAIEQKDFNPNELEETSSPPKEKKNNTFMIIVLVLLLLIAGVGGYYVYDMMNEQEEPEVTTEFEEEEIETEVEQTNFVLYGIKSMSFDSFLVSIYIDDELLAEDDFAYTEEERELPAVGIPTFIRYEKVLSPGEYTIRVVAQGGEYELEETFVLEDSIWAEIKFVSELEGEEGEFLFRFQDTPILYD